MTMPTFEDAARAANSVVNDPEVIAKIRQAAGIPEDPPLFVDSDWYTLDEIDHIERLTGDEFPKFMNTPGMKSKHLRILALIVKRRTDPNFPDELVGSLKITFVKAPIPPTESNGYAPS